MITTKIHSATLEDVPQLVRLMEEFYNEAGFPLDHGWAGDGVSALLADHSRGAIWIVFEDAQPAGYAVLTLRFSMEQCGLDAFIDDLFIRPAHRRRGLGRLALQALFQECRKRGVLAVHVEVGRDNAPAQSLYASYGLARRKDFRELLTVSL
ncbi:MAG: GNAT family N-acetyltransferase [Verrucomicrobiota bacterium]|nr:GNAT family N-acetyltransferase [Verrucomicrobiota bacterium]